MGIPSASAILNLILWNKWKVGKEGERRSLPFLFDLREFVEVPCQHGGFSANIWEILL